MIKSKLNSNRGSTLVFSLVALLIASIVCAVVIYSAEGNAGRIRSAQQTQQAQQTLRSAASVVRDQLAGNTITLKEITRKITTTTNGISSEKNEVQPVSVRISNTDRNQAEYELASGTFVDDAVALTSGKLTKLQEVVLKWCIAVMEESVLANNDCYGEYQIIAKGPNGDLDPVKVKIRLEPGATSDLGSQNEKESHEAEKYYLTVSFTTDADAAGAITMSLMATSSIDTTSGLVSKVDNTTKDDRGNLIRTTVKTEETTKRVEVTWADSNVVVNAFDGLEENNG